MLVQMESLARRSALWSPPQGKQASAYVTLIEDPNSACNQLQHLVQRMTAEVDKVVVVFRAAGGAPILQQSKVKVSGDSKFSKIVVFLRKQLRTESVFVYLRDAFCPSLDDDVSVLTQAYGVDGKLHVNYALTPAWG